MSTLSRVTVGPQARTERRAILSSDLTRKGLRCGVGCCETGEMKAPGVPDLGCAPLAADPSHRPSPTARISPVPSIGLLENAMPLPKAVRLLGLSLSWLQGENDTGSNDLNRTRLEDRKNRCLKTTRPWPRWPRHWPDPPSTLRRQISRSSFTLQGFGRSCRCPPGITIPGGRTRTSTPHRFAVLQLHLRPAGPLAEVRPTVDLGAPPPSAARNNARALPAKSAALVCGSEPAVNQFVPIFKTKAECRSPRSGRAMVYSPQDQEPNQPTRAVAGLGPLRLLRRPSQRRSQTG